MGVGNENSIDLELQDGGEGKKGGVQVNNPGNIGNLL